jgi:hypothetical protein
MKRGIVYPLLAFNLVATIGLGVLVITQGGSDDADQAQVAFALGESERVQRRQGQELATLNRVVRVHSNVVKAVKEICAEMAAFRDEQQQVADALNEGALPGLETGIGAPGQLAARFAFICYHEIGPP